MIVACAALLACAVWVLMPSSADPRVERLATRTRATPRARDTRPGAAYAASVIAAVGAWLLVGGVGGFVVGLGCVALLPRILGRFESRSDRRRRDDLARQAPLLAELLAATLASGATVRAALGAVGSAVGEPTADVLRPIVAAIDLGAEPMEAWAAAETVAAHRPILEALVRATQSGAPLSRVLTRIAEDMRRERKTAVEVAARSAGVRAVAPLAACFLPAFLLTGVVPVVAALAGGLLGSR